MTLAEHTFFLERGEVRFDGSITDLLSRDDLLRPVFLASVGAALGTGTAGGSTAAGGPAATQTNGAGASGATTRASGLIVPTGPTSAQPAAPTEPSGPTAVDPPTVTPPTETPPTSHAEGLWVAGPSGGAGAAGNGQSPPAPDHDGRDGGTA